VCAYKKLHSFIHIVASKPCTKQQRQQQREKKAEMKSSRVRRMGVKIKFPNANGNYHVERENLCVPLSSAMVASWRVDKNVNAI
jgi:hypothetical protein